MLEANKKSGSRAQQFAARHEVFLGLWAEGLHLLEIGRQLNLSANQLAKHALKAFEDKAPRVEPAYACILWDDLPSVLRSALPCEEPKQLVKIEAADDGVIMTLMASATCENSNIE